MSSLHAEFAVAIWTGRRADDCRRSETDCPSGFYLGLPKQQDVEIRIIRLFDLCYGTSALSGYRYALPEGLWEGVGERERNRQRERVSGWERERERERERVSE